ncbi:MAG TPA: hypothetical protein VEP48_05740 [Methylomirabilota bacterium]|nr:hypothetical protein [Methylomirabilota bacterium]
MIEFLTSDTALLFWSSLGLAATAMSIVRDTRTQRMQRTPAVVKELPRVKRREKIAA